MKLILDNTEHYNHLLECVNQKPAIARIATYGIYAGIMADGRDSRDWDQSKYHSQTRDLLEALRSIKKVQILVGNYDYKSCAGKQRCEDCERKYVSDMIRLLNHVEKFSEFEWRVSLESHAKCSLFYYMDRSVKGVAGGRNMTDSFWADVTVELDKEGCDKLTNHFTTIWKQSEPITEKIVCGIIESKGIPPEILESQF